MVGPVVENTPQTTWRGLFLRLVYKFCAIKKLCTAVCPEKPHTRPRRRTQRSDQGSHNERPGEFLAVLVSVQNVTKVAKKNRKGHILRFLTPNAKESMEPSWRSGTLAVYQVPQKNSHNGRISIMIITILHYHCIGNIG